MKYLLIGIMFLFATVSFAQEEAVIALEKVATNAHDMKSIKRGAKFFSTTCIACHTLIYMRYNKVAQEAGITYDKMPTKVTTWPLGVKPPDLSLEVSRRGADWVYTYLHSFYLDPSRPTGANNLLVPDTAMAGIILAFQGQQIRVPPAKISSKLFDSHYQWYDLVEVQTPGSMTPEQFDATIVDLVNFLAYASEPYKVQQEYIGIGVIIFLMLLLFLIYLLKREYWKMIDRPKQK